MKTCTKCCKGKREKEFFGARDTKDGLRGECKECHNKWARTRYSRMKGIILARHRKHYEANTGSILEKRRKQWPELKRKKRFQRVLATSRRWAKEKGYMPCTASEEKIANAFTGSCYICNKKESECKRFLSLDHNHITGEFRGWLCSNCNRALGLFGETSEIIKNALEYINGTKALPARSA